PRQPTHRLRTAHTLPARHHGLPTHRPTTARSRTRPPQGLLARRLAGASPRTPPRGFAPWRVSGRSPDLPAWCCRALQAVVDREPESLFRDWHDCDTGQAELCHFCVELTQPDEQVCCCLRQVARCAELEHRARPLRRRSERK